MCTVPWFLKLLTTPELAAEHPEPCPILSAGANTSLLPGTPGSGQDGSQSLSLYTWRTHNEAMLSGGEERTGGEGEEGREERRGEKREQERREEKRGRGDEGRR